MTGDKYTKIDSNGNIAEQASVQTSAGAGNAGNIVGLNASGQIDNTMLPEAQTTTITASEALAAGAYVNIYNSSGIKVRNADASAALPAHGFTIGAVSNAATATVILANGSNTGVTGLTVGSTYFLGNVGAVTTTPPTTATYVLQKLGVAKSATELETIIGTVLIRA